MVTFRTNIYFLVLSTSKDNHSLCWCVYVLSFTNSSRNISEKQPSRIDTWMDRNLCSTFPKTRLRRMRGEDMNAVGTNIGPG